MRLAGWKEQFFRWWFDYSVKVPVPRDDYNLQLAEPFDFGYRMSNLVRFNLLGPYSSQLIDRSIPPSCFR
jgi:hypothetical protein